MINDEIGGFLCVRVSVCMCVCVYEFVLIYGI